MEAAVSRWRLLLEYNGGGFCGWQSQATPSHDVGGDFASGEGELVSVQDALAAAIFAFCGERVVPIGAGRTDSGVHALGQVAHVDLPRLSPPMEGWRIREALNAHLRRQPLAVLDAKAASAEFHARFDATARRYLYRIANRRPPPVLERGRVWHVAPPLDADAMGEAAALLVGRHDFTTFRAARCQAASPVKTLDALETRRVGEEIHIRGRARSFLYHQMRSMVGALKQVGEGKWRPADVAAALEARERAACPMLAPAAGLYLEGVEYADA